MQLIRLVAESESESEPDVFVPPDPEAEQLRARAEQLKTEGNALYRQGLPQAVSTTSAQIAGSLLALLYLGMLCFVSHGLRHAECAAVQWQQCSGSSAVATDGQLSGPRDLQHSAAIVRLQCSETQGQGQSKSSASEQPERCVQAVGAVRCS